MEKRTVFASIDQSFSDIWIDYFETLEEANEHADLSWYHLTNSEKEKRHCYVLAFETDKELDHEDLQDDLWTENIVVGGEFDSKEYEAEQIEER